MYISCASGGDDSELGHVHADSILQSCRIKGFAALHYTKKRKLVQRPPLTVAQVSQLEECVRDTNRTLYDRAAAWIFLGAGFWQTEIF